jgi:putative membrane protein
MGSADIVPGVSGGTIAFIFGIYEQLIQSIKTVTGKTLNLLLQKKIKQSIQSIPVKFLLPIFIGILSALFSLANIISYLLDKQPVYIWSFLFGLVLSSIIIVKNRVKSWNNTNIILLITSTICTYILVGAVPVETSESIPMYFLSGVIAICAMILPGISGSFLLVIMGKYQQILNAVVEKNFIILIAVMAGAVIGLALFARVLSWLFKNYHDLTISILIGFLIGSLRKVWPWKVTLQTYTDSHGEILPLVQKNIFPPAIDYSFFISMALFALGIFLIIYLEKKHAVEDLHNDT